MLFVGADCNVDINGLAALSSAIARSPSHDVFQLRLVGNPANLVGRAVDLRLVTFQSHMLQSDGRVRCLNTAGFAIRRATKNMQVDLFDPSCSPGRGSIIVGGSYAGGRTSSIRTRCRCRTRNPLYLLECLRKDIRSAFTEKRPYDIIAAKGIRILLTHRERLHLLRILRKTAGSACDRTIGFLFACSQAND